VLCSDRDPEATHQIPSQTPSERTGYDSAKFKSLNRAPTLTSHTIGFSTPVVALPGRGSILKSGAWTAISREPMLSGRRFVQNWRVLVVGQDRYCHICSLGFESSYGYQYLPRHASPAIPGLVLIAKTALWDIDLGCEPSEGFVTGSKDSG
jgi:hypothetical protein